jgi:glycosyltransferase involved in cell wall biosynthesis
LVITVVARLFKEKGHDDFFAALAEVRRSHPEVLALLVGDGRARQECEYTVQKLNLEDNVLFAGLRDDVPAILDISDVYALSSHGEGLSIAILEAMASGKAIVATDVGGNRELIDHGQTGLLVPARDPQAMAQALAYMLENPEQRSRMGESARVRARDRFSLREAVRRTEALYEELLRQKGLTG